MTTEEGWDDSDYGYGYDYDKDYAYNFTGKPWEEIPEHFKDRQHFVSTVKERLEYEASNNVVPSFCFVKLWEWVFESGQIDCCKALLDGDILPEPDLPLHIDYRRPSGLSSLDFAALDLNYESVKFLLDYGARTDRRNLSYFPINHAVKSCGRIIDQRSKTSFNNLFIALCRPEMEEGVKTVTLLACNTREVSEVFNDYAKEGKLVEMAILGIVAMDCVMPREDASVARESIAQEGDSLASRENQLLTVFGQGIKLLDKFNNKKAALMSASWLLHLFENAGYALWSYFRSRKKNIPEGSIIKNAETIFEKKGVLVNDVYFIDIDCTNSRLKKDAEALLACSHLGYPLDPHDRFHDAKDLIAQTLSSPAMDGTRKAMEAANKWDKSCSWSGSPGMRVEHTWLPHPHLSPATRYGHPVRDYNQFIKQVQCKERIAATRRAVHLPTGKLFDSLPLALKRGIRLL